MDAMIGKTLGRYRIVEHLGRGGMAEVYKAYHPSLDRYVAVKVMHTFLADDQQFLQRFEREAKVVATLRHPNIVQVFDFDADQGIYYMVMEFIQGETLKTRLQALEAQRQWLSADDAVRVVLAVGSALKYAHERGMVHRDVKPANVMITTDGQVILTDFGIAKIVSASNLTASGAMVGTPSYMAPEQGMGQPGDERSDIYSLGVMLYQLVLGRLPFDADTPLAVVLKHINEPLPLPKIIKPDLSPALDAVIEKALAKDPAQRYQKVGEMLADLRAAAGFPPEDVSSEAAAVGAAIKLSGATVVGRVSALTPPPRSTQLPPTATGTQVAAAKTQVAAAPTVVAPGQNPPPPAPPPATPAASRRPGWIIPVIVIAVIAVGAIIVGVLSGNRGAEQPPTATPTATFTITPTSSPTMVPLANQLQTFNRDQVPLSAQPDATTVQGLLPQATQFYLRARTADMQWVKIETPDGVAGWVPVDAVLSAALSAEMLAQLPAATVLTKPTDTPTATVPPSPTSTLTPIPTVTNTPAPTNTAAPTVARPTETPKPTLPPAATATPEASPTAAVEPLGYGFSFKFCTYDGGNYTCNIEVWGSGGDGKYHFALENPDTGNWDEKTGSRAEYIMRSRRCKIRLQQLRLWDESGNHMEPNITLNPDDIPNLFPGGTGCVP